MACAASMLPVSIAYIRGEMDVVPTWMYNIPRALLAVRD